MALKRHVPADETNSYTPSGEQQTAEAFALRPDPAKTPANPDERMSVFWRVFGGAIVSVAALGAMTMYNSLANNLAELRGQLAQAQSESNRADADLRSELGRIHEGRSQAVTKADFDKRVENVLEVYKALQTQNTVQNANLASMKAEQDGLKERLGKFTADVDGHRKEVAAAQELLKKEQAVTTDALKKELATLDVAKERLAAASLELKALQSEAAQVRQQLERNQAYDQERKESRDRLQRQTDELIKELQKAVQDNREKLARLEGQVVPAKPPTQPEEPK